MISLTVLHAHAPLPPADPVAREEESKQVEEMGKAEVFSLSKYRLAQFVWDRYWKGNYDSESFTYFGANPTVLTPEQAEKPAILFCHAFKSNHGEFLPLLHRFEEKKIGPCFTFNYDGDFEEQIIRKIEAIRELYLRAGKTEVSIILVGHSLGATNGAGFGFSPEKWPENTRIAKIIAIAGRLRNIDRPEETPYYNYCHDVLERLFAIEERILLKAGGAKLFTITAENDWLIPRESIDIGEEGKRAVIANKGHLLVIFATETAKRVEEFIND